MAANLPFHDNKKIIGNFSLLASINFPTNISLLGLKLFIKSE